MMHSFRTVLVCCCFILTVSIVSDTTVDPAFRASLQRLHAHYRTYLTSTLSPDEVHQIVRRFYADEVSEMDERRFYADKISEKDDKISDNSAKDPRPAYALTPVQINMDDPDRYFFWFDPKVPLAKDADVLSIHDDFYGVPWASLVNVSIQPPVSWMERIKQTQLAIVNNWGNKSIFLSMQMTTGTLRSCPAANATDGPDNVPMVTPFVGCTQCYEWNYTINPAAELTINAYMLYATFLTETYQPMYVNFAPEINLPQRLCPDQWEGLVNAANHVYAILKNLTPFVKKVFPSLQLETIMGLQSGPDQACKGMGTGSPTPPPALLQCIDDGLALVADLKKDAFAVSTYPGNQHAGLPPPTDAPFEDWYFPVVFDKLSTEEKQNLIIAETGFISDNLIVNMGNGSIGTTMSTTTSTRSSRHETVLTTKDDPPLVCEPLEYSSVNLTATWLNYTIRQAQSYSMIFMVWWSDMDLLANEAMSSCPCNVSSPLFTGSCTFISAFRQIYEGENLPGWDGELNAKAFGTMGLRTTIAGDIKQPLYSLWEAARKNSSAFGSNTKK